MSDWISVDDRLPEQGDFVDAWAGKRIVNAFWDRPMQGSTEMYWAHANGSDPFFTGGLIGGFSEIDVTHWMPLPEPPND